MGTRDQSQRLGYSEANQERGRWRCIYNMYQAECQLRISWYGGEGVVNMPQWLEPYLFRRQLEMGKCFWIHLDTDPD